MPKRITGNLAGFIYDEDLQIGHEACLWKCKDNDKLCPFGENITKEQCIICTNEYLDKN